MGRVLGVLVAAGEASPSDLACVLCFSFSASALTLNWAWDRRGKLLEESGSEDEIVEREESWDRVAEKAIGETTKKISLCVVVKSLGIRPQWSIIRCSTV